MNWYRNSGYKSSSARAAAHGGLSNPAPLRPPPASPLGPLKYTPPSPLGAANQGVPHAGGMFGKLAGRGLLRFIPYLGWALLAYELWELYRANRSSLAMYMLGYQQSNFCPRPVSTGYRITGGWACPGNVFVAPSQEWSPSLGTYPSPILEYWHPDGQGFSPVGAHRQWHHNGVGFKPRPTVIPQPQFDPWSPELPVGNPSLEPEVSPIGVPVPVPAPVPWRAIPELNPWPEGPVPMAPPQPAPNPEPELPPEIEWPPVPISPPLSPPVPGPGPSAPPAPTPVQPNPGPGAGPQPANPPKVSPSPRVRRPPGPRTKETKKRTTQAGMALVYGLTNAVTETADMVEAFWWALPAKYRHPPQMVAGEWRKPALHLMSRDLYRHWDKVDINKGMQNALENLLEDAIAGSAGQASKKAVRNAADQGYWHRPFGFGTGPAM